MKIIKHIVMVSRKNGKVYAIIYLFFISICIFLVKLKIPSGGYLSIQSWHASWNRRQSPGSLKGNTIFSNEKFAFNLAYSEVNFSFTETPMLFYYLPHLNNDINNLQPILSTSTARKHVWLVMGIATVFRKDVDYLTHTVESLISNLLPQQQQQCIILVCVTEIDEKGYYQEVLTNMKIRFSEHLESGLLEVIASPSTFYPNLTHPSPLFGDSVKRAKWRRKQNLDYVYLMTFAQTKGHYYLQLEDDVIASNDYFSEIYNFVSKMGSNDWLVINFSKLGFIGKFFRSTSLTYISEFLLMFYREKPCDWLLLHFIELLTCDGYNIEKVCEEQRKLLMVNFYKPLFQHIGKYSSLKGKIQLLQETNFISSNSLSKFKLANLNPPAAINTTLEGHMGSLQGLYSGLNEMFWGKNPKLGDIVSLTFQKSIRIDKYIFHSGSLEHPGDRFYDTELQILTAEAFEMVRSLQRSQLSWQEDGNKMILQMNGETHILDNDGFITVDKFSKISGLLTGQLYPKFGPIKSLRLFVKKDSASWVILTKIIIIESKNKT